MINKRIVNRLYKATYSYDVAHAIKDYFDGMINNDDSRKALIPSEVCCLSGAVANKHNYNISTDLSDDCVYIFYQSSQTGKYIPFRISMTRKTMENYYKGSSRFGSRSILKSAI